MCVINTFGIGTCCIYDYVGFGVCFLNIQVLTINIIQNLLGRVRKSNLLGRWDLKICKGAESVKGTVLKGGDDLQW